MTAPASPAKRLPASIWALGFVSLLMDVSSEMIHSLLPVFLVASLGVSMLAVGLIEGAAEATALLIRHGLLQSPDAVQLEPVEGLRHLSPSKVYE